MISVDTTWVFWPHASCLHVVKLSQAWLTPRLLPLGRQLAAILQAASFPPVQCRYKLSTLFNFQWQHCCAVQTMVSDPDAVLAKLETDFNDGKPIEVLTEGVREAIIKNVKRRMTPQPLKIRADVELTCFSYDGVLHIQVNISTSARASTLPAQGLHWTLARGLP